MDHELGAAYKQQLKRAYHFPQSEFFNLVRSVVRPLALMIYKTALGLLGLQVLKICTPDLIMLVKNNEMTSGENA